MNDAPKHALEDSVDLDCDRTTPRRARAWVAELLDRLVGGRAAAGDLYDDAILVASELATSALIAGSPTLTLRLAIDPGLVRLAVIDESEPTRDLNDPLFQAQWQGLRLVDAIAARWGVDPAASGREVWVELAR